MSIAVDLDGTLAHYDHWRGVDHIGAPIPKMVDRVIEWLKKGEEVVIFTARVAPDHIATREPTVAAINRWCVVQFGQVLRVTAQKEAAMEEFWDDKAVGIRTNTGEIRGEI